MGYVSHVASTGSRIMPPQVITAACLGIFFGVLTESFGDVKDKAGHVLLGFGLLMALLTASFFLSSVRFYGEAPLAIASLCFGSVIGWQFSETINTHWRKDSSAQSRQE